MLTGWLRLLLSASMAGESPWSGYSLRGLLKEVLVKSSYIGAKDGNNAHLNVESII